MNLQRSSLFIGDGRLSGAVQINGEYRFYIDNEGVIEKRVMQKGRRGVTRDSSFLSHACEHTETESSTVSIAFGELEITGKS